jgi:hypothetical protein
VLKEGKHEHEHEQGHDDASKKVTAPTGVAIVKNAQGFHPNQPSPPKSI